MTLFLSQRAALSSSFHSVLSILPSFLQTSVSAHRIKELVDLPKEVHIARSSELDAYIEQGFTVNMDDVNFSYISMKKRFTRLAVGFPARPAPLFRVICRYFMCRSSFPG